MMQAHYRSILDFTNDGILAAEKGFNRLMEGIDILKELLPSASSTIDIATWKQNCYDAMNDDFNTPILIANLFEGIKFVNLINDGKETLTSADLRILTETLHTFTFDVIGVKDEKCAADNSEKLDGVVEMLIGMRNEARANKNFALSDQIRDQLLALGIQLKDGKDGTTFTV
jgi:cysteinyl-tRNA synthetase